MGWRHALARAWTRLTTDPPCPWCGDDHDPRDHTPLHDDR